MPKTGIATYQGYVLGFNPVEANLNIDGGGEYYDLSEFNVDFANKQLTGTLDNWKSKSSKPNAINIKAKIRANTFQGTANKTGYAEGKFYGPAAQNLAGAFEDKNQNLHGVFGANKQ
ncbi:MAG: transferrin-binding protein-like solute binding protein [Neisseriaceae bacterium]|nr:transferrin-binding protein-like solute binding protein [Neisseriaceae bacterium]